MESEITLDELWDVLDLMMKERYDANGVDFMMALDTGTVDECFPGAHDLVILAEPLRSWDQEFDQDGPV